MDVYDYFIWCLENIELFHSAAYVLSSFQAPAWRIYETHQKDHKTFAFMTISQLFDFGSRTYSTSIIHIRQFIAVFRKFDKEIWWKFVRFSNVMDVSDWQSIWDSLFKSFLFYGCNWYVENGLGVQILSKLAKFTNLTVSKVWYNFRLSVSFIFWQEAIAASSVLETAYSSLVEDNLVDNHFVVLLCRMVCFSRFKAFWRSMVIEQDGVKISLLTVYVFVCVSQQRYSGQWKMPLWKRLLSLLRNEGASENLGMKYVCWAASYCISVGVNLFSYGF